MNEAGRSSEPGDRTQSAMVDASALCLSGGGYRAMVFHIGALWRLYDAGLLGTIDRISSVSGGSITSAVLALNWNKLTFDPANLQQDFVPCVVEPLRTLASTTIDVPAILRGLLLPGNVSDRIVSYYNNILFDGASLQDLPDAPRFVINATNLQSGVLWRFSKPYMRDYRVGEIESPDLEVARAVAASSAFPPFLSPVILKRQTSDYVANSGTDLQREPYTTRVVLSDGGVYDNLGLQTAENFRMILVSDGGGQMQPQPKPRGFWPIQMYRVLNVIDNQVRAQRKSNLIDAYIKGDHSGAYWGIRTDIADYKLSSALDCPYKRTLELAATPTRLKAMAALLQERLINWGYAVCDAALRKHVDQQLQRPAGFPYPKAGV